MPGAWCMYCWLRSKRAGLVRPLCLLPPPPPPVSPAVEHCVHVLVDIFIIAPASPPTRLPAPLQAGRPRMSLWVALLPPHAPRAMHRDATVAVVGFTSWAAVAGKILSSMSDAGGASRLPEALIALVSEGSQHGVHSGCFWAGMLCWVGRGGESAPALLRLTATHICPTQGAALLCLWPLALTLACPARYARWRELLIPAHLAVQHWIGLHFSTPLESHAKMVRVHIHGGLVCCSRAMAGW